MKILIVGGLGYVGGRLATYLRAQNYKDITLTSKRSEYPVWARDFDVRRLDLQDVDTINECLGRVKPDVVVHLSALQQAECQADPDLAERINEFGTRTLVESAKRIGVRQFIYFSTFQIYGDFIGRIDEQTQPNPKSVYASSKLKGEEVVQGYGADDFVVRILRLSNAYGAPVDDHVASSVWTLAVNAFCQRAVAEGSLLIKSNQYRDFVPMGDVVRTVEHFLNMDSEPNGVGVYNLGGKNCLSILQMAQQVSAAYQTVFHQNTLEIEGPTQDQDKVFEPFVYVIDKLESTGFKLSGTMKEEIQSTLEFCKRQKNGVAHE